MKCLKCGSEMWIRALGESVNRNVTDGKLSDEEWIKHKNIVHRRLALLNPGSALWVCSECCNAADLTERPKEVLIK